MARLHKRYKHRRTRKTSESRPRPRQNPPLMSDLVEWVVPGFGGFAASRFVTRLAATQIAKRWPRVAKHAGALAAVGSFLSAWYLVHKIAAVAKYHTPVTVGAAIAAAQSLIQLYLPGLGWMIADATPELAATSTATGAVMSPPFAQPQLQLMPVDEDPNEYTYNDLYDPGRYNKTGLHPTAAQSPPIMAPTAQAGDDLSDLALDDALGQSPNLGVFSAN